MAYVLADRESENPALLSVVNIPDAFVTFRVDTWRAAPARCLRWPGLRPARGSGGQLIRVTNTMYCGVGTYRLYALNTPNSRRWPIMAPEPHEVDASIPEDSMQINAVIASSCKHTAQRKISY